MHTGKAILKSLLHLLVCKSLQRLLIEQVPPIICDDRLRHIICQIHMAEPAIPHAVPVCYGCLVPDEGHPGVGTLCPASAADYILTETHIRNRLTGSGRGTGNPLPARYQFLENGLFD